MTTHDMFLSRIMNHFSTIDMYGSGFANFGIEDIGGVQHVVAQTMFGQIHRAPIDAENPEAVYRMFDLLQNERLASGVKDGTVYGPTIPQNKNMPGVLSMSHGMANFRRKGIYRNQQLYDLANDENLRNLSQSGNYRITQLTFDKQADGALNSLLSLITDNPNEVMNLDEMSKKIKGLVLPTKSGLRLIQITKDGGAGEVLNWEETARLVGLDPFNVQAPDGTRLQNVGDIYGKKGKRYRGHFQEKGISLNLSQRMKAAVFDPRSLFGMLDEDYDDFINSMVGTQGFKTTDDAEKALKQMFDGQIIAVRPGKLIRESEKEGKRFIDSLEMDDLSKRQASDRLSSYITRMRRGGAFNVRLTNPEFVGLKGTIAVGELAGNHLKGNMSTAGGLSNLTNKELKNISNDKNIDNMTRALAKVLLQARNRGIDFLSPIDDLTTELGNAVDGMFQMGIAVQNESHIARTNVTTLVGQPSFYDVDQLEKYARDSVKMELDNLRQGSISGKFLENLRQQADMVLEDFYDYNEMTVDQMTSRRMALEEARAIVDYIDSGGSLLDDPAMVNRVARAIKDTYYGTDPKNPNFIIPNARSGHIAPDKIVKVQSREFGNERFGQLDENFIAYDKTTNQFIFSTKNALRHQQQLGILGGADYDDTINTALFYDRNASKGEKIAAAIYRNPTGYGEGLVLRMHANDDMVVDVLLNMNKNVEYDEVDRGTDRAFLEGVQNEKNELVRVEKKIAKLSNEKNLSKDQKNVLRELRSTRDLLIDNIQFSSYRLEEIAERVLAPADDALQVATRTASGETVLSYNGKKSISTHNYRLTEDLAVENLISEQQSIKDVMKRGLGQGSADRYSLGEILNFRTFMESLLHEDIYSELEKVGFKPSDIAMSTRETIIDYFMQLGGTGENASNEVDAALRVVAQALVESYNANNGLEGAVKLPFSTASLSGVDRVGLLSLSVHAKLTEIIQEILPDERVQSAAGELRALKIDDFIGNEDTDTHIVAKARKLAADGRSVADQEINKFFNFVSNLNNNSYVSPGEQAEDYRKAARSVIEQFNQASLSDNLGLQLTDETLRLNDETVQRILAEAASIADSADIAPSKALQELLLNIRSEAANSSSLARMLNLGYSDSRMSVAQMLRDAKLKKSLELQDQSIISDVVSDIESLDTDINTKDRERILRDIEQRKLSDDEIRQGVPGQKRYSVRAVSDAIAARIPQTKTITEGIKALWHNDVFRKGFYGVAAVAAASAIYQNSKDVSPEEMQGPEFLPGGSAYEDFMQPGVDYPSFNGFRSQAGTTYSIQTNGQYDPAMVTAAAEQITGVTAQGMISYRQPVFADINRAISNGF